MCFVSFSEREGEKAALHCLHLFCLDVCLCREVSGLAHLYKYTVPIHTQSAFPLGSWHLSPGRAGEQKPCLIGEKIAAVVYMLSCVSVQHLCYECLAATKGTLLMYGVQEKNSKMCHFHFSTECKFWGKHVFLAATVVVQISSFLHFICCSSQSIFFLPCQVLEIRAARDK